MTTLETAGKVLIIPSSGPRIRVSRCRAAQFAAVRRTRTSEVVTVKRCWIGHFRIHEVRQDGATKIVSNDTMR